MCENFTCEIYMKGMNGQIHRDMIDQRDCLAGVRLQRIMRREKLEVTFNR